MFGVLPGADVNLEFFYRGWSVFSEPTSHWQSLAVLEIHLFPLCVCVRVWCKEIMNEGNNNGVRLLIVC